MLEDEHIIRSDIDIDGVIYQFERREFSPGFSIVLPKSFDYMATECVKRKYPYEERPSIILSNEDTTINFLFDCMDIEPEELSSRLKKYKAAVRKMNPSNVFFSENTIELENGLNVACYDYLSSALDDDIYNLCFITDLSTGELFGCFNCPFDVQVQWEALVRQMIKSIEILPIFDGSEFQGFAYTEEG